MAPHLVPLAVLLAMAAFASCAAGCAREPEPPVVVADREREAVAPTATAPGEWPQITTAERWSGLDQPLLVTNAGDGSGRLFIAEKTGRVRMVDGGALAPEPFLDLGGEVSTESERGLLGLAFSPRFAEDGTFYTNHTDRRGDTLVTRFKLPSPSAKTAAGATREVVLKIRQPYPNHNGGCIAFGPDGLLYVGMGDGGSAGDPHGAGQDRDSLLGKMLRLDVARERAPKPEVWAIGLRNPWRFSFDPATGDLWIGDVGQGAREEIDLLPAGTPPGANLGWSLFEGSEPFPPGAKRDGAGITMPVAEYGRAAGSSVTGGVVYRGSGQPKLRGIYLYADFVTGRIWGLRRGADGKWENHELADTGLAIASFGVDENGEVYVCDLNGSVHAIASR